MQPALLGLPPLAHPPAGDRVALGARLFFDPLLSADGSMACSSCHLPEQAFTVNGAATAIGLDGRPLRRNAPTLLNVAFRQRLFHDGRESDLARQAFGPLLAANEMGNPSTAAVLGRLAAAPYYREAFAAAFNEGLTEATLGRALADFQRSLIAADSAFDRWYYGGEREALSEQARAGFFTFSAAGCGDCHSFGHRFAHFTDDALHRTGVTGPDVGFAEVSGEPQDRHRFRTPTLRNVALTAPYFHDGRLPTLMAVIDFYAAGGGSDPDGNPVMAPVELADADKQALVAFLESLTGSNPAALAAAARAAAAQP